MISNTKAERLGQRIHEWVSIVDAARNACHLPRCQLFSDTVFAPAPSSQEGLQSLVSFARTLLTSGIEQSFLVRGGIAHGSFTWGELTYGPAVVEAHGLESRQKWIGVAAQSSLPHVANLWNLGHLVCYTPPMKDGHVQIHPVVTWDIPEPMRLTKLVALSNTMANGESVAWDNAEKISNTIAFRMYLAVLASENLDPSKFYGAMPCDLLDVVISRSSSGKTTTARAIECKS